MKFNRTMVGVLARGGDRRRAPRGDLDDPTSGQLLAGSASLVIVGAVLWPVLENWRKRPRDGFPLSYYPMFSAKRSTRLKVTHLVGVDAAGRRFPLPYRYAGSGGLNQVRRQIRRTVARGRAADLCERVAGRVVPGRLPTDAALVAVEVVTGDYRLTDYFAGKREPVAETVHATAPCSSRTGRRVAP